MFTKGIECLEKWNCILIIWTVSFGKGKFGSLTIRHPVRGVHHWLFCTLLHLRLRLLHHWWGYASNWSQKTSLSPTIRRFLFCTRPVSEKTRYCTIANCNCPQLYRNSLCSLRTQDSKFNPLILRKTEKNKKKTELLLRDERRRKP